MTKADELNYHFERIKLLLSYLQKFSGGDIDAKEIMAALDPAYQQGNLKGLRMASRDITSWLEYATAAEIAEVTVALRNKFGPEETLHDKINRQLLQRIRTRKQITSAAEHRLVRDHVGDLPVEAEEELVFWEGLLLVYEGPYEE